MGGYYFDTLWVNGCASYFRLQDYQPGKVDMSVFDPKAKIYLVSKTDPPFSRSWIERKDAVELGANFYDVEIKMVFIILLIRIKTVIGI